MSSLLTEDRQLEEGKKLFSLVQSIWNACLLPVSTQEEDLSSLSCSCSTCSFHSPTRGLLSLSSRVTLFSVMESSFGRGIFSSSQSSLFTATSEDGDSS